LAGVLASLPSLDAERDPTFLEPYLESLAVGYCEASSEAALADALAKNASASVSTLRGLKVALQEEQRCLAIRSLMATTDDSEPNAWIPDEPPIAAQD
jgi:aminopeptidase N